MILLLLLVGCTPLAEQSDPAQGAPFNEDVADWKVFATEDESFKLTVFCSGLDFTTDEKIEIFSLLEYTGEQEEVRATGSDPAFHYVIRKGDIFINRGFHHDTFAHTNFIKGEPVLFPFRKNGVWDASEPDASFHKAYTEDPDLHLPAGEYDVEVYWDYTLDYSLALEGPVELIHQGVEFVIKVE